MGVTTGLDKSRRLFDSLAETHVSTGNPKEFTAGLIVFNDLKSKAHGINGARKNRLRS